MWAHLDASMYDGRLARVQEEQGVRNIKCNLLAPAHSKQNLLYQCCR